MGTYYNPDNESFRKAVKSRIYIDKTGLICYSKKRSWKSTGNHYRTKMESICGNGYKTDKRTQI